MSPFPARPAEIALPIVLRPKTGHALWIVLGSLVLAYGGFRMMLGGDDRGILVAAGFLFCAAAFSTMLIPGACFLRMERDGFTETFLYRSTFTRWSDVESIFVVEQKSMGFIVVQRFVGINYTPEVRKSKLARKFARTFGASEALVRTNGWNARELSELMNRCHAQALGRTLAQTNPATRTL